jgi:tetratricopeptide (TPR) repeat protein
MELLEVIGVVAGVVATVWAVFFGSKTLRDVLKGWREKQKQRRPSLEGDAGPVISGGERDSIPGPLHQFLPDFTELVEDVKNCVSSIRYEDAVSIAKRYREEMVAIGDENDPVFRLVLGELDVWYAHAQIYTGATDEAIERLQAVITTLEGQGRLYEKSGESILLGKRRWSQVLGRAHNHIGYAYWMDHGNYEAALKEFSVAISYLLAEEQLREELATAYDNMGRVYAQLGYQSRAELLIGHGLRIREVLQDSYRHALSLNSKAIMYLAFGQPYRALVTSEEALEIFRRQGDRGIRGVGLALLTKGRAQRCLGAYWRHSYQPSKFEKELRDSIKTLEEARGRFHVVKEDIRLFEAYNELGCAYRELLTLSQGSDTESAVLAKKYLEKSIEEAPREKYPALYVDACEDLARVHLILNEHKKASCLLREAVKAVPDHYKLRKGIQLSIVPLNWTLAIFDAR